MSNSFSSKDVINNIVISKYAGVEWVDGITPLESDNLNKSEVALESILGVSGSDSDGLLQQIVNLITSEIDARKNDDTALNNSISTLTGEITSLGNEVDTYSNSIITLQDTDSALKSDITELETTLSDLNTSNINLVTLKDYYKSVGLTGALELIKQHFDELASIEDEKSTENREQIITGIGYDTDTGKIVVTQRPIGLNPVDIPSGIEYNKIVIDADTTLVEWVNIANRTIYWGSFDEE